MPAEDPMFSVTKYPQPTRNVVERTTGYQVVVQSRGRSLRAVALAGGRWSSSMVTSLSWRSAIVAHSQSLRPASKLRGRLNWFQVGPWSNVRVEQRTFGASGVGRVSERRRFKSSSGVFKFGRG